MAQRTWHPAPRPTTALAVVLGVLALAACARAAGPQLPARPCPGAVDPVAVLKQLNTARASARVCGSKRMPPAPPLTWDDRLAAAAGAHASDMARRGYFDHDSPEGRDAGQRVRAAGYRWSSVGENIAQGEASAGEALRGWLGSADHCENIMAGEFAEVALACARSPSGEQSPYWTMVFGRKR